MTRMMILLCVLGIDPTDCTPEVAVREIAGPLYLDERVCEIHSGWFERDAEVQRHARRIERLSYARLLCVQGAIA